MKIVEKDRFTKGDIIDLLKLDDNHKIRELYKQASLIKEKYIDDKVYYRGIIEFSNICIKNCLYCGIRKDNNKVERFTMTNDEIMESAKWAYENGYGSIVLQSGERQDREYIDFVTELLREIKKMSNNELGITLSLGEQTEETYREWFDAGAHRYLLRIETTNKDLYEKIHPKDHSFETRKNCLIKLREIGYQVGTGVMIGIPGQTIEDLADDIMFFRDFDIDMIGMGPYISEKESPLTKSSEELLISKEERFELGLKMIATTRLVINDINIAATTALQALNPIGRELGIKSGANIIMPIITNRKYRKNYQLYDDKPCVEDSAEKCKSCLMGRMKTTGYEIGYNEWGDSPHFGARLKNRSEL